MKKVIKIINNDVNLILENESVEIISIPKDNLTIDGKKLFDNFISKLDITQKVEFDYVYDKPITDSNTKRITADIELILNSIAQKINDKFKLLTEDVDVFLNENSDDFPF